MIERDDPHVPFQRGQRSETNVTQPTPDSGPDKAASKEATQNELTQPDDDVIRARTVLSRFADAGLVIAATTAIAFVAVRSFMAGFLSYYGVPADWIDVPTTQLFAIAVPLVPFVVLVGVYCYVYVAALRKPVFASLWGLVMVVSTALSCWLTDWEQGTFALGMSAVIFCAIVPLLATLIGKIPSILDEIGISQRRALEAQKSTLAAIEDHIDLIRGIDEDERIRTHPDMVAIVENLPAVTGKKEKYINSLRESLVRYPQLVRRAAREKKTLGRTMMVVYVLAGLTIFPSQFTNLGFWAAGLPIDGFTPWEHRADGKTTEIIFHTIEGDVILENAGEGCQIQYRTEKALLVRNCRPWILRPLATPLSVAASSTVVTPQPAIAATPIASPAITATPLTTPAPSDE